jgi:protein-disulfide isomerase
MRKKKVGKRQLIRERRRRQARMRRFVIIGGVVIVAVLIAFAMIYPNLQSAGEIAAIEAFQRPMEDGTAMGNSNAPVRIDVFEDFQCPACAFYTKEVERRIAETYVTAGQVYYVFHHYPFIDSNSASKESHQAANASMCAMEQNKFWEYHDILFANWNGEGVC